MVFKPQLVRINLLIVLVCSVRMHAKRGENEGKIKKISQNLSAYISGMLSTIIIEVWREFTTKL